MAAIADTLTEISEIQEEFKDFISNHRFVWDLMNFTSVVYFDYLSHHVLDGSRGINLSSIHGSDKYYELFLSNGLLEEYIRINNIGHLSFVWNAYEKYLREKHHEAYGTKKFKINVVFSELLEALNMSNNQVLIEEFEVIRNTRNSLHEGGIYNENFRPFEGSLVGKSYSFNPGQEVVPLRTMDVVSAVWSHYKIFESCTDA